MAKTLVRVLLLLAIGLVGYFVLCPRPTLPIYRLAPPAVSAGSIPAPARKFMPGGGTITETADRVYVRSGTLRLEVYKASGGFWLEDSIQLWNPEITPQLPDSSVLRPSGMAIAARKTRDSLFFYGDSGIARFEFTDIRPTFVTTRNSGGVTSTVRLDWQVGYAARVADRRPGGARQFPVTGGGGEIKIHYGDGGSVIGHSGVWREIRGVARRERQVSRRSADAQYRQRFGATPVIFDAPRLAYYSAPAPFAQDSLYPVYVYSGTAVVGGDSIPLPDVMIPATKSGGASGAPEPGPQRTSSDEPRTGSMAAENPEEREVAATWLGSMDGLPSSMANVTGLLGTLSAAGWTVNFDWGNANAWFDDWNSDRARWVDAADLVFYSGHAKRDGWKLFDQQYSTPQEPQYTWLSPSAAAAAPGMYGGQDLEWIVISACGPLQDDQLSPGGGSAIDRWDDAFGGLHLLLGYGSVVHDVPDEGRRFAELAIEGKTLVNAWLRAAAEVQPSTNGRSAPDGPAIWAGAMWARKYGVRSPYRDRLWGIGVTAPAPDPTVPDDWSIIWSPT